jgi:hypothetical protein
LGDVLANLIAKRLDSTVRILAYWLLNRTETDSWKKSIQWHFGVYNIVSAAVMIGKDHSVLRELASDPSRLPVFFFFFLFFFLFFL